MTPVRLFIHFLYTFPASFIKACRRSDPELNLCIKEQVESIRPYLLKGIPELQLPPYDPMRIPQLLLDQGTGSVRLRADFRDIVAYGAKNAVVKDIK